MCKGLVLGYNDSFTYQRKKIVEARVSVHFSSNKARTEEDGLKQIMVLQFLVKNRTILKNKLYRTI